MAGNAVKELLQSKADPIEMPTIVRGYISGAVGPSASLLIAPSAFPVPGSEMNLLWVIAPEYETTRPLGPCAWSADHGTTLPAQDAKCVVAFDNEQVPTVIWWEGAYSVNGLWEPGDLKVSARTSAGAEWVGPCKGQAVSRITYAALFAAIGTTYGEGNKTTTFNLPDGEGRFLLGASGTHPLGASGGEETVKLTTGELAAHSHGPESGEFLIDTGAGAGITVVGGTVAVAAQKKTGSAGSGEAHENMPPWTTVNLFIHV